MPIDGAAHSIYFYLAIGAFIIWRVYKRISRLVGRQRLHPVRPWATLIIFPLLLALISLGALAHPNSLLALAGGVALGIGLGIYGKRLTRFEVTPEGLFYTPNAHLGIALSLLFIGRLAYRFIHLSLVSPGDPSMDASQFGNSPITLLIFGTLAGYYTAYAFGLLQWKRSVAPQ